MDDQVNLNDLQIFVEVMNAGSFAAAARRSGRPKSTLSKRVAALEADLGAKLLHRTSRRLVLTALGQRFLEHARAALIEAESAETIVKEELAQPRGTVRITASVPVAQFDLAPALPKLARTYPELKIVVHVTDRFVDIVQEGYDIAIRSHFAPLADISLIQRRLVGQAFIAVAAPSYLAERGMPTDPDDLSDHDGLLVGEAATVWRFRRANEELAIQPLPRLCADETMVLLKAAEDGLGIVCLPRGQCLDAIQAGRLVHILPGWTAGEVTTTILTTHRRGQLPSVRAVVDFLAEQISPKGRRR